MKNRIINLVTLSLSFIFIIGIFSCNDKEVNSEDSTKDSQIIQQVEPPSMDIHTAVFMGNIKAVQQHIIVGTDLNIKDEYGSTPLNISVTFDKTDIAGVLIDADVDLNIKSNEGSTALHTAAFLCRKDIVEMLLEKGADRTIKNIYGSTPLESVSGPFKDVKDVYDQLSKDLGSLGLKLDYKYIEETRPIVAEMLKESK